MTCVSSVLSNTDARPLRLRSPVKTRTSLLLFFHLTPPLALTAPSCANLGHFCFSVLSNTDARPLRPRSPVKTRTSPLLFLHPPLALTAPSCANPGPCTCSTKARVNQGDPTRVREHPYDDGAQPCCRGAQGGHQNSAPCPVEACVSHRSRYVQCGRASSPTSPNDSGSCTTRQRRRGRRRGGGIRLRNCGASFSSQ